MRHPPTLVIQCEVDCAAREDRSTVASGASLRFWEAFVLLMDESLAQFPYSERKKSMMSCCSSMCK
jgi:hypothetical protein